MKKGMYIQLLEEELTRLRERIRALEWDVRDLTLKCDPVARAMQGLTNKMAQDLYGVPEGLEAILKDESKE